MTANIVQAALDFREAGLSPIPILLPEKRPAIKWGPYMMRIADDQEVRAWFKANHRGVGLVAGSVSGNLFLIEADAHGPRGSIAEKYIASVMRHLPGVYDRLYVERSKSGGMHFVGRCAEPVGGGLPLARYPGDKLDKHGHPKPEVWLELLGERDQFVTAPTPGYTPVQGSLTDLPVIDAAQFNLLLQLAADFNEYTPHHIKPDATIVKPKTNIPADLIGFFPGEAYNAAVRANLNLVIDLITGDGWKQAFERGDNLHFTRPGKERGTSATLQRSTALFYVFTSSTELDQDRAYSPAGLFCEIECNGDWRKTIEVLADRGYGDLSQLRSIYDEIIFRESGGRETGGEVGESEAVRDSGNGAAIDDVLIDDTPAVDMPDAPIDPDLIRSSNPELPGIVVTGNQMRDTVAASIDALAKRNHPAALFVRTGRVVRLVHTERETPQIDDVTLPAMRVILSQAANFFTIGRKKLAATHPPRDVTEGVLNLGEWPFPPLLGVVTCPQMRPDGSILSVPGYDAASRVIYAPAPGLTIGDVPMMPTGDDVQRAIETIFEPFAQFPFVSDADRVNFFALLLTPILRTAIRGPVPLAVLTATAPGTGKSLMARAVARIATGHDAPFANWPEDDAELRKFITSSLRAGGMFTVFDNLSRVLHSDVLSQALTGEVWQDRLLGGNTQIELPNRSIWMATGNNIEVAGDLARRCFRIALDANLPRPWERGDFVHHDLIGYLGERRGDILHAMLTLARAWYVLDCPASDIAPLGSFEDWTRVIGGILQYAGIVGFLGNRADLYADSDAQEWEAFLIAWYSRYENKQQVLGAVVAKLVDDPTFAATLPGDLQDTLTAYKLSNAKVSPARRLGKALRRIDGRLFGTNETCYRVCKVRDSDRKAFDWFVDRVNPTGFTGFTATKTTQVSFENSES